MVWTKSDEEKRLCQLWLREPLINPETGHSIDRNGPTFNNWRERCRRAGLMNRPKATKVMTWRKCQEWRRNPHVNPDTGRKIDPNGPTGKWIAKECQALQEREIDLLGEYYLPDRRGMVPCVIHNDQRYVVRTFTDRKVWGPLNKPAKVIKLCYYTFTWDYQHGHYRPIFIDSPPKPPPEKPLKRKIRKNDPRKENPKYMVDTVVNLFIKK